MKRLIFLFLPALIFGINVSEVYYKCAECHGLKGEKSYWYITKPLNELSKSQIIKSLKYYRKGDQQYGYGLVMKREVGILTDEEIEAVAEYIKSDDIITYANLKIAEQQKLIMDSEANKNTQTAKIAKAEQIEKDLDEIIESQKSKPKPKSKKKIKPKSKPKELPKPTKEEIAKQKDKELKRKQLEKLGLGYLN